MMKKTLYIISACALIGTTSCLDEQLPQTNGATAEQVANADKAGLVNGLVQYMNTPNADESDGVYTGLGYPEYMIWHDIMTQDTPVLSTGYYYWTAYSECLYMGNWAWQSFYWWYYNSLVYKATLAAKFCERGNEADALSLATARAYRAFALFDMARMYEFRKTGTSLDGTYYDKLKGLTVPIVNENTTEERAKDNPRVPFYTMYRYVLNDLLLAQEAIEMTNKTAPKNNATPGMVYGLMARFWLELGSRFERHPSDLAAQIEHDSEQYPEFGEGYQDLPPIGVKNANEAFANAAKYARMAINCGYTPLTRSQWYDTSAGFNSVNGAWIWAIMMSSSDPMCTDYTWESWVSFKSPEAQWGISGPEYRAAFMADAKLFGSISNSDWRKLTWVNPADWVDEDATEAELQQFRSTYDSKYNSLTTLSFDDWSQMGPYVGFKFRPGSGNTSSSETGNKVDIPMMRVEEMYFIEAEALAHTQGVSAGATALADFINTYRYTDGSYVCNPTSLRNFERELVLQKRIEFWGEGVVLYDYKRLELPIERGYVGSNHPVSHQYNSKDGYVAPWTILYIPLSEQQQNKALVLNPDPSSVMLELKY